jgi:hypothetical protein
MTPTICTKRLKAISEKEYTVFVGAGFAVN